MKKLIVLFAMLVPAFSWSQCQSVRFAQVDWTDVQATTAVAAEILQRLDYQVQVDEMSVPQVYESLANGSADVFLGNWMPSMEPIIAPYQQQGRVTVLAENLNGAKYTLAVPDYVYQGGVRSFADLARFKDRFKGRIHGLEKGNDGNALLLQMIDKNDFGLAGFNLLQLPERLMLRQVERHIREQQWIAFLAWAPHPMNNQFNIKYLAGGDEYFGPNYGGATVHTNVRAGFAQDCPNVARLLNNLTFDLKMEGQMMDMILNQFVPADRAVRAWMHKNPQTVARWLNGVSTQAGQPANAEQLSAAMKLTIDH